MPIVPTQEEKFKTIAKIMDRENAKKLKRNPDDDRPALYYAGARPDLLDHGLVKSGNLALDTLLHGGYKRSTLTVLYGAPNCGKTSLVFESIAEFQRQGLVCGYCHSEAGFPIDHARRLGVDMDKLVMIQDFTNGEEMFNLLVTFLSDEKGVPRNILDFVAVDSIAALVPKYVLDKMNEDGLESQEMGSLPKMLTNATRRIFGTGALGKTAMVFINQIRDNLSSYGGQQGMPGGHAVKHFSHVTIKVSAARAGYIYEGTGEKKRRVGHTVKLETEKNKAGLGGHPGEIAEYTVKYNVGTDNILPLFNASVVQGTLLNPSSGWYQFDLPKAFLSPMGLWKEELDKNGNFKVDEPLKIRGQESVLEILRNTQRLHDVMMSIIRDGVEPSIAIQLIGDPLPEAVPESEINHDQLASNTRVTKGIADTTKAMEKAIDSLDKLATAAK